MRGFSAIFSTEDGIRLDDYRFYYGLDVVNMHHAYWPQQKSSTGASWMSVQLAASARDYYVVLPTTGSGVDRMLRIVQGSERRKSALTSS